jgi:hypothetical protein
MDQPSQSLNQILDTGGGKRHRIRKSRINKDPEDVIA